MKCLLQRVAQASVTVDHGIVGEIQRGLLVFVGVEPGDTDQSVLRMAKRILSYRIFPDDEGKMNHSAIDVNGQLLIISQFTLHASTKKGNRPSYIKAAKPDKAIPLYEYFVERCKEHFPARVQTGEFGANMKVSLVNDGPVTIIIDTQNRE